MAQQHQLEVLFEPNTIAPLKFTTSKFMNSFTTLLHLKRVICKERNVKEENVRLLGIEPVNFNSGQMTIVYQPDGLYEVAETPISKVLIGNAKLIPSTIICRIVNEEREYFSFEEIERMACLYNFKIEYYQ